MPVYASGPEFGALKQEFVAAEAEETAAIRHASTVAGLRPVTEEVRQATRDATARMEAAHSRKLDVLRRMEAHRLDKA
jgi:hypothetical protein